jgi:hypothetical protein
MRPYRHQRLEEYPDVADLKNEARKTGAGKLRGKGGDYRAYRDTKGRKQLRRSLKRADKAKDRLEDE